MNLQANELHPSPGGRGRRKWKKLQWSYSSRMKELWSRFIDDPDTQLWLESLATGDKTQINQTAALEALIKDCGNVERVSSPRPPVSPRVGSPINFTQTPPTTKEHTPDACSILF